jgi:RHS repeat-associated protein
VGLDNFGRVVGLNWLNAATGTSTDNFAYTYDPNSNVTAKNNLLNSAYSEAYQYDQLNRLADATRNGSAFQSWSLDALGNWSSFTNAGTTQTRTANNQNQITSISGSAAPLYDANGNMTTDQSGNTLIYDAWNRLVSVKNPSGVVIANYSYNAMGYRIIEDYPAGLNGNSTPVTKYLYYSSGWQVIEERQNGTANTNVSYQYVWSASYIDAMILRDQYANGAMQANSRLYTQYDANFNVTALIGYNAGTQTWGVVQRFVYSPYGTATVLTPTWTATTDAFNWQYMHQSGRLDPISGLYLFRHRDYSPTLGVFVSEDPAAQYGNLFLYEAGSPADGLDASGLWTVARKQASTALATPQAADTMATLAHELHLNPEEWRKWATVSAGPVPKSADAPVCSCVKVSVPNTFVVDMGNTVDWNVWSLYPMPSIFSDFMDLSDKLVVNAINAKFHVIRTWGASDNQIQSHLSDLTKNKSLYAYAFFGHGVDGVINPSGRQGVFPGRHTAYGIANMMLLACDSLENSGGPVKYRGPHGNSHWAQAGTTTGWRTNVARRGWLSGFFVTVYVGNWRRDLRDIHGL